MTDRLLALRASIIRLRSIIEGLEPAQLRAQAYPSEWTVGQVMSHLGSAGVIMQARLDAELDGREVPDTFAQSVWDEWNAKDPDAQTTDALEVDRRFLERVESLDDDERARARVAMGPITFDFAGLLRARLSEHALHTWDVEVVVDPNAAVPPDAAEIVLENLAMIVQYAGKPNGSEHDVSIRTFDPARWFTLSFRAGALSLGPGDPDGPPDLELAAESFVRLVYGRLDPDHTPPVRGNVDVLDELRRSLPGV